jgi:hypothetical protein
VTGCSRYGKAALIAGALEDLIALTVPQEGGSGAAGCWRVVAEIKRNGTKVEDAVQISGGDQWFTPSWVNYVHNVNQLPYDHHELIGLVAPLGLLVIENTGIDYLAPASAYTCSLAVRSVFEALGAKEAMGFSQVAHANHCGMPSSQNPELTAWIRKYLIRG